MPLAELFAEYGSEAKAAVASHLNVDLGAIHLFAEGKAGAFIAPYFRSSMAPSVALLSDQYRITSEALVSMSDEALARIWDRPSRDGTLAYSFTAPDFAAIWHTRAIVRRSFGIHILLHEMAHIGLYRHLEASNLHVAYRAASVQNHRWMHEEEAFADSIARQCGPALGVRNLLENEVLRARARFRRSGLDDTMPPAVLLATLRDSLFDWTRRAMNNTTKDREEPA